MKMNERYRAISWWLNWNDMMWPDQAILDKLRRRADQAAEASVNCVMIFGMHFRWDHMPLWDRLHDPEGWERAFDCLAEGNKAWVKNAPILLLSVAAPVFRTTAKPNRWNQHDTGAASENLCLQATALGLVAHQMGGFDAAKARERFAIPDEHVCMAMIAVGHPAHPSLLEGELRSREEAPRERLPLGECFFQGEWGKGIV